MYTRLPFLRLLYNSGNHSHIFAGKNLDMRWNILAISCIHLRRDVHVNTSQGKKPAYREEYRGKPSANNRPQPCTFTHIEE